MAISWTTLPAAKASTQPGDIPDYFGTATSAPEKVIRLAKVPGADPDILQQFADAQNLHATIASSLGPYFDALRKSQPSVDSLTAGDLAQLNFINDPMGYQAAMANLRARRKTAVTDATTNLLGDLRRSLSMGRIGGGGGAGLSSYLSRIAAGEAGKLRVNEALDAAGQERSDLGALIAARQGTIGKGQTLIDSALSRLLTPIDATAKAGGLYGNAIQQALQTAILNSLIGVGAQVSQ